MALKREDLNVLILSIGFMMVFTSYQTMSIIEIPILNSIKMDDKTYSATAFISFTIIYAFLAIGNFLAASFVNYFGTRNSIICGALSYVAFISSFFYPHGWILYVASVILGLAAAIMWTAQGAYLTENSHESTISRNSGLFWAIFQCSLLFGNLFCYFMFDNKKHIDQNTRIILFSVLTGISVTGVFVLLLLKHRQVDNGNESIVQTRKPLQAFYQAVNLLFDSRMLLLSVTFLFTGMLLTFAFSIYGSCIGATTKISDDPKKFLGLAGVFLGLGEVSGGTFFGILGKKTWHFGRSCIVLFGFFVIAVSVTLIFLNLPDNVPPFNDTSNVSYITNPNKYLAVFCSFLLGFGDSSFNTQIYSIIGSLFADDSAPAFALFKFIQSVSSAAAFAYSSILGLYAQLLIIGIFVIFGTAAFVIVDIIDINMKRLSSVSENEPKTYNSEANISSMDTIDST